MENIIKALERILLNKIDITYYYENKDKTIQKAIKPRNIDALELVLKEYDFYNKNVENVTLTEDTITIYLKDKYPKEKYKK